MRGFLSQASTGPPNPCFPLPRIEGGQRDLNALCSSRSKDEKLNNARRDRGTLIASGFIAGGALMGVISAVLRMVLMGMNIDLINEAWFASHGAELLALGMFAGLCAYMIWDSMRAKVEED